MHRGRHSKINSLHYFIKRTFMHIPSKAPLTPLSQLSVQISTVMSIGIFTLCAARDEWVCVRRHNFDEHITNIDPQYTLDARLEIKQKSTLDVHAYVYIYIYKPARTQRKAPPGHVRIWCCINVLWSERLGWMENVADGIKSLCVCTYMSPAHGIITSTAPSEWEIYTEREEEESFSWKF